MFLREFSISGNPSPIRFGIDAQACYNLVYLELAACRLTSLPAEFSLLLPNVRALNLNYNFLESDEVARGLSGLKRLRKLTIVGNRMTGTKALMRMLNAMGQGIEMLDFRYALWLDYPSFSFFSAMWMRPDRSEELVSGHFCH